MITEEKLEQFHRNVCSKCKNKNTDLCEIRERIDGTLNCINEEKRDERSDITQK